jgi:hypothetical protein
VTTEVSRDFIRISAMIAFEQECSSRRLKSAIILPESQLARVRLSSLNTGHGMYHSCFTCFILASLMLPSFHSCPVIMQIIEVDKLVRINKVLFYLLRHSCFQLQMASSFSLDLVSFRVVLFQVADCQRVSDSH